MVHSRRFRVLIGYFFACVFALFSEITKAQDLPGVQFMGPLGTTYSNGPFDSPSSFASCFDTDFDGVDDCSDACPFDFSKSQPGECGCGIFEFDSDGDGRPDCFDLCAFNPGKTDPGLCGCEMPDDDHDADGVPDCYDHCPFDGMKLEPGQCGCGTSDTDSDGDTFPDCWDLCPNDPAKLDAGICGCGVQDIDGDSNGSIDCSDECPHDIFKISPGICGCGVSDLDTDGDGSPDCYDLCPTDIQKFEPGACGCDSSDADGDADGIPDCQSTGHAPEQPIQESMIRYLASSEHQRQVKGMQILCGSDYETKKPQFPSRVSFAFDSLATDEERASLMITLFRLLPKYLESLSKTEFPSEKINAAICAAKLTSMFRQLRPEDRRYARTTGWAAHTILRAMTLFDGGDVLASIQEVKFLLSTLDEAQQDLHISPLIAPSIERSFLSAFPNLGNFLLDEVFRRRDTALITDLVDSMKSQTLRKDFAAEIVLHRRTRSAFESFVSIEETIAFERSPNFPLFIDIYSYIFSDLFVDRRLSIWDDEKFNEAYVFFESTWKSYIQREGRTSGELWKLYSAFNRFARPDVDSQLRAATLQILLFIAHQGALLSPPDAELQNTAVSCLKDELRDLPASEGIGICSALRAVGRSILARLSTEDRYDFQQILRAQVEILLSDAGQSLVDDAFRRARCAMLVLPQFDNSYDGDYLLISRILSQSSYQSIRTTAAAALSEYSLQAPVDPGCCVVDRLKEMVNSESSEQRLAGARALENVLAASSEEDAATLCADIGNTLHNPLLSMALRIQSVEAFRAPEIRAAQQVGFSLFSRCGKLSIADAETIRRTLDAYIQIIARDIGSSGDVITLAANVENVLTPVRLLLSDAGDRAELTRRIYLPSLERMFDLIRPGQFLSDATILLAVTMEDTDLENLKCTIDSWRTGEGNERYLEFVLEYAPDSRLSRIISNDFTRQIGGLVIDLGDPPMENLP